MKVVSFSKSILFLLFGEILERYLCLLLFSESYSVALTGLMVAMCPGRPQKGGHTAAFPSAVITCESYHIQLTCVFGAIFSAFNHWSSPAGPPVILLQAAMNT